MQSSDSAIVFTAQLHVFVQGGFSLFGPDGKAIPVANRKARGLIAYLALCPGGVATRERLCGLLWSDRSEHQARGSLRQTLKKLRVIFEKIGFHGFETGRNEISIDLNKVTVDLQAQAGNLAVDQVGDPLLNENGMPEKILYGYEGLDRSFETWLREIRRNWGGRLSEQLYWIMENSLPNQSKRAAQAIINIDPTDEAACRNLMRHYADFGKTAMALKQYEKLWDLLTIEYDLEPGQNTQELNAKIKAGVSNVPMNASLTAPSRSDEDISRGNILPAIVLIDLENAASPGVVNNQEQLRQWQMQQEEIILAAVVDENGEITRKTKNRTLVEFGNCYEALKFTLKVQELLTVSSQKQTMPFFASISTNVNKFSADEQSVFGDDLNITDQLLSYSDIGSVVMTSEFYDQVCDLIEFTTVDLGFLQLKNTIQRVRARKIVPRNVGRIKTKIKRGNLPSIAVLPFKVFGSDPKMEFLANGMVHEIVGLLASLREAFVISSGSTFQSANVEGDLKAVARKLGVRYILAGSIVPENELLNIRVELIDTDDLQVVWTGNIIEKLSSVFEVQHSIAMKTTYALLPHLRGAELQRIAQKVPGSLDSYDCVLKGMEHLYKLHAEDFKKADEYFSKAIELDPENAAAYAMKAKWNILYVGEGLSVDVRKHSEQALKMAKLALKYDPLNSFALSIYGHINSFLFKNYREAIEAFERAISASPNSAIAWGLSAPTYSYINEGAEAIKRVERAMALSPLEPYAYFYKSTLTAAHYNNGDYEDAIYWGKKTMATAPRFVANLRPLIASLSALGEIDEARVLSQKLLKIDPCFSVSKFCKWYPIKDVGQVALYAKHLSAAGVPA